MAAFLGDIAFLFGILITTGGLLLLHRAGGDPRPVILRTAAILMLAGGIGTALCTGYFWMKYHFAGDLEHAYPPALMGEPGGKGRMQGMGMGGNMMGGMMGGRMSGGMTGSPGRAPDAEPPTGRTDAAETGHESHHPEPSAETP
jgi:hypothetical protein